MSRRERALLISGVLAALFVVVYPIAYRMSSEPGSARVTATPTPAVSPGPTVVARPTVRRLALVIDSAWLVSATEHRGADGQSFVYECPPDGGFGEIWGTDTYTDDSSVCTAGVHQGSITRKQGGTVMIMIRPGLTSYVGSARHGVTSESFGLWDGSYEVLNSAGAPEDVP